MNTDLKIAIISTVYNEISNIDELISSLVNQSLTPDEIVILDGGSTDGTWEYLSTISTKISNLRVIQDDTCSLAFSKSPIARGRNQAISVTTSEIIACVDAGCTYEHDWLYEITKAFISNNTDVCIGGSCVFPSTQTKWDIAAAPFLGFDISGKNMPKTGTGTARSLAFKKTVWTAIGGFPEHVFASEDTEYIKNIKHSNFFLEFNNQAIAYYSPNYSFKEAINRLGRYAFFDGVRNLTPQRYLFMSFRIITLLFSIYISPQIPTLLLAVIFLEMAYSVRRDLIGLIKDKYLFYLPFRIAFSIITPWIFFKNYTFGLLSRYKYVNPKNIS